jgi:hypothetical protein
VAGVCALLVAAGAVFSAFSGTTTNGASLFSAADVFPPGDVTGVSADAGEDAQVPVSWAAANRADSYEVRYRVNGAPSWVTPTVTTALTSTTVTGLVNGTTYEFQVRAVNSGGVSAWSSSVTATPSGSSVPVAPSGVTATSGLNGQVPVSWNSSAGATSYTVQYRVQAGEAGRRARRWPGPATP